MTRYEFIQSKIDKITNRQRECLNILGGHLLIQLLEDNKKTLIYFRDNMNLKEASKKADWFFRVKFD